MSDTRSSMLATLADIRSNPSTPNRERAVARIESAQPRMDDYDAGKASGGLHVRAISIYEREHLMSVENDASRGQGARDRASRLLDQADDLREGDLPFIRQTYRS